MKQHGKWYDCVRPVSRIRPAIFVMATMLMLAAALSAQTVVDFERHNPTCDDPCGSRSRIAPVLTVPVWSDHKPESVALHSQLIDHIPGRAIERAQVSPPPGKGGCTYDCGTTTLGPPKSRRGSRPVTTAGSPV
jgi:hypothetical protein